MSKSSKRRKARRRAPAEAQAFRKQAEAIVQQEHPGAKINRGGTYAPCAEGLADLATGQLIARFEGSRLWRWLPGDDRRALVCVFCGERFQEGNYRATKRLVYIHHLSKHAS